MQQLSKIPQNYSSHGIMRTLSLIREENTFRIALLRKDKKGLCFELLKTIPVSEDVKPLYMLAPALENGSYTLSTALNASEVLFRKLTLPLADQRKALAALPFQLESLLPYPAEETILAPILKKTGKNALTAALFTTRTSCLADHLETFNTFEIDPDIVSCTPIALFRLRQWLFPKENHCALFYWGQTKSLCVISNRQEILLTHPLHFGLEHLYLALSQDFPKKSKEELKVLAQDPNFKKTALQPLIHFTQAQSEITQELRRLSTFLKHKQAIESETSWCMLGACAVPAFELSQIFSQAISSSFLPVTEQKIQAADLDHYALAIGLGLNALADDAYSIQLRQGKWTPTHQLRRRRRFMAIYAGICGALTCLMALFSHTLLHKKESHLAQELTLHLPSSLANDPLDSEEQLRQKLWEWEKTLTTQHLSFPFLHNLPKVSDVLAWISTHPSLNPADEGKIEIQSMRYQMVKYPKLGESTDPYVVRVDLEFTASSPRLAREFHDALLKGDAIVNARKEIKWTSQNTSYFTSFELNPLKKGEI